MTERPDPDPSSITRYIVETFDDVDVAAVDGGTFFACDPDTHWPAFATVVTSDAFDDASNLGRPGVFRVNISVGKSTFDEVVGGAVAPDFTALDRVMPHPVYAKQHWVCVLNPSAATFERYLRPMLAEAYARVKRESEG